MFPPAIMTVVMAVSAMMTVGKAEYVIAHIAVTVVVVVVMLLGAVFVTTVLIAVRAVVLRAVLLRHWVFAAGLQPSQRVRNALSAKPFLVS